MKDHKVEWMLLEFEAMEIELPHKNMCQKNSALARKMDSVKYPCLSIIPHLNLFR